MIEVVNRQRKLLIDGERWREFAAKAVKVLPGTAAGIKIAFVSDRAMSELNLMWRHKRGTTDVLSFPAEQDQFEKAEGDRLGDVVISVEQASRQAKENGLTLDQEIRPVIFHRLLHILGFDQF